MTHERLKEIRKDEEENSDDIKSLEKRMDRHDKIFGGISMFVMIVTVVFGLIINSNKVVGIKDDRKAEIKHQGRFKEATF